MSLLETVYASAGDNVIIRTIELTCPAWGESIRIAQGFEDLTLRDEFGVDKLFLGGAIDIALPKKEATGVQNLAFAIDNVTGIAQRRIDEALEAEETITLIHRVYLASDLTAPAEAPFVATVLSGQCDGTTVQVSAGFYDLINSSWPRDLYTLNFAPCLKYL